MGYLVREFRPQDAGACLALFRDCVHRVNSRDYSTEQIDAWAPLNADSKTWASRFEDRFAYVSLDGDQIVGFTDMTPAGHLDRLFVSADHQGQGIGRRLVDLLLGMAEHHGIGHITVDASITAKPFFERMRFMVVREQTVTCRGVAITNYRMRRPVDGAWRVEKKQLPGASSANRRSFLSK